MNTTSDAKTEVLRTIMQELFSIEQHLNGIVHSKYTDRLKSLEQLAHKTIEPELEIEEKNWEINQKALDEISSQNKFRSVWSVSSIDHSKMNELTPEIKKITYESWGPTQVHTFDVPTRITWLELWKIGDELISKSGDTHHIFIESFTPSNDNGDFKMFTGS